ncbi:MAG: ABC transporter permease [Terriglobales bacterium]
MTPPQWKMKWALLYPVPGGYRGGGLQGYHEQLLWQLARLPGVEGVAYSKIGPVSESGYVMTETVSLAGRGPVAKADYHPVSAGFFDTLGIPFVSGRGFDANGAVVNETLARRMGTALGRTVILGSGHARYQVTGIVADARLYDQRMAHAPAIFVPILAHRGHAEYATLLLRTRGDWMPAAKRAETAITGMGREFPIRVKSVTAAVELATARQRSGAEIGSLLALAVLLLAMISTYAMARSLADAARREWAIRTALGAGPRQVFSRALASPLIVVAIGVAAGIPIALAGASIVRPLPYQTSPMDLRVLAAAAGLLLLTAAGAALRPAWKAAHAEAWPVLHEGE